MQSLHNANKVVVDNYRPIAYCQLQLIVARLCYKINVTEQQLLGLR